MYRRLLSFLLLVTTTCVAIEAAPPTGYYDGLDNLTRTPLKNALHNIVFDHTVYTYANAYKALEYIEEDPDNTANILTHYGNDSILKSNHGSTEGTWNREHLWPQSLGSESGSPMYTDLHHLFAEEAKMNTFRSNSVFANVTSPTREAKGCKWTSSEFEPRDDSKGDIARALMYMEMTYGVSPYNYTLINGTTPVSGQMGVRDTLLQWHLKDPVDARDLRHNERVYEKQGNRNPYTDNPEFATRVYDLDATIGGTVSAAYDKQATESLTIGTTGNVYASMDLTLTTGTEWNFGQLHITKNGTAPDSDISAVRLYADLNRNKLIDATDLLLQEAVFANDSVAFDAPEMVRAANNAPLSLLVSMDIANNATSGSTVALLFPENAILADPNKSTYVSPSVAEFLTTQSIIVGASPTPGPIPPTPVENDGVVINKFLNALDNANESIELLITKDNTSLVGLWLKDFSSSGTGDNGGSYQFNDVAKWKSLKAGTLIALFKNGTPITESSHVLSAKLTDTTLFTTGGGTFDIAKSEIVMIKSGTKTGTENSIHALGTVSSTLTKWTEITTGLKATTETDATSGATVLIKNSHSTLTDFNSNDETEIITNSAPAFGTANNAQNDAFIKQLLPVNLSFLEVE